MTSALAVTDTHALLWASAGKLKKLGPHARRHFERTDAGEAAVYVPTVVLVEVDELHRVGKITLPLPFPVWCEKLAASGTYIVADLTADIVRRAHDLFDIPERGDRLIAATALALEVPLMTRDGAIAESAQVARLCD